MAMQYTNRRGEVYQLQKKPAKGGGVRYSCARKLTGTPVDAMPEGYEFREVPEDAQVVIRRIKPTVILPLEVEAVRQAIQSQAGLTDFIVEAEGKEIIIYLPDAEPEERIAALASFFPMAAGDRQSFRDLIRQFVSYIKMMRFVLSDTNQRLFSAERWCFLGSIDTWHWLEGHAPLAKLLDKYVRHLGKESFYELM